MPGLFEGCCRCRRSSRRPPKMNARSRTRGEGAAPPARDAQFEQLAPPLADRNFRCDQALLVDWDRRKCDVSLKFRSSSSRCESCPAKVESTFLAAGAIVTSLRPPTVPPLSWRRCLAEHSLYSSSFFRSPPAPRPADSAHSRHFSQMRVHSTDQIEVEAAVGPGKHQSRRRTRARRVASLDQRARTRSRVHKPIAASATTLPSNAPGSGR